MFALLKPSLVLEAILPSYEYVDQHREHVEVDALVKHLEEICEYQQHLVKPMQTGFHVFFLKVRDVHLIVFGD
jgi:hypothetical protein